MEKQRLRRAGCLSFLLCAALATWSSGPEKGIYRNGWMDLNKNGRMDVYENPAVPVEERIKDLLSQMTLEEKTCQMATLYGSGRVLKDALPEAHWKQALWKDGIGNIDEEHNGIGKFGSEYAFPYTKHVKALHDIQRWFVEETRLGIPVDFTNEGIRGLCHDRATFFPSQSGQGSTWNKELIARIGEVEAKEANALGYTNIYSPILDICQDPRWGRSVECYGEDPYLAGQLGKQMIQSLQNHRLVSTVKHFAVYSIPVGGRDGKTRTDPHVAPREMRTLYLEPFRRAFTEAGALGVMSSYNDYDGEPITGSHRFLTEILRQEFGFKGYVVSDSEAVEFITTKHRVVADEVAGVAQAVNAGLNVRTHFTKPEDFVLPLRQAVKEGKVSIETIDSRVADILRVKFWLGLFDNPYRGDGKLAEKIVHSKEHQQVALEAARQSLVLLKNEGQLLPLKKTVKSVAVIGPNADEREQLICRYGPANAPIKTVYQGIKEMLPAANIIYKKGCDIVDSHFPESEILAFEKTEKEQKMLDEAVEATREAEVVILVLGGSELTVREDRSRTSLDLPGHQQALMEAVYATGKPVVLVLLDGRASTINYANRYIPSILHAWFPGEFTGTAIAEALFGDYNPGGRLAVTFPKSVGQIPFAFPFKPGSDETCATAISGALFPFGHGLSYTKFRYDNLLITPQEQAPQGEITVTCEVTNTGNRRGDEVVQLYLRDEVSSVTTYTKVLRGFERISLNPNETRKVTFTLTPQDLGIWDKNEKFTVEPGSFKVMVGASSTDIRLDGKFTINENRFQNWGDKLTQYVVEKYMPAHTYIFNWNEAVFLKAAVARCEQGMDKDYLFPYIQTAIDSTFAEANGHHPNAVVSGLGLAYLAHTTGEAKYKEKAFEIFEQYKKIPKATNGGVSHRDNVIELWDDTVYMVGEYLMQMYKLTGDKAFLLEAISQLKKHAEKLEDAQTGLWYHGWNNDSAPSLDPCCQAGWDQNPNRRNNEFWGRGNGWILMTLVDLMELLPKDDANYTYLKASFTKKLQTLLPLQDKATGHWYQLPMYPGEKGNFIESSSTAMYAYAAAKGIVLGILPADRYTPMIERAYTGLEANSLQPTGDYLNMKNICDGTCIGDKQYYYNRGIVNERAYALGIATMFYDQYHQMHQIIRK